MISAVLWAVASLPPSEPLGEMVPALGWMQEIQTGKQEALWGFTGRLTIGANSDIYLPE